MEVAPFFVDFHHFLSIVTIFYRFSRFTHFCRDLHFVTIYALFPQFFFGQNSLLRNITRFLHVWGERGGSGYSPKVMTLFMNSPLQQIYFHIFGKYENLLSITRGEQWSFFGSDGMGWFFSARTIGINGFLMVLLPLDHHH